MLAIKTTPFHPRTSQLMQGNQWRRWAGHTVASAYELTPDRETMAIRNACALIDVSALFKYHVRGADAGAFLDRLVTRDVKKMAVGHMLYTPWCNSHGKLIDDGTIAKLSDTQYRLTAAESNWRWLHDNAPGFAVDLEDVSDELGALSLQGPTSRATLEAATGSSLAGVKFHRFTHVPLAGTSVMVSRTGYTGDLGYEIWVPRAHALAVWDALVAAGRGYALQPTGIWAMDVCRIEGGLIMLDVDYTPAPKAMSDVQTSTPYELGLGWAVHLDKGEFVGRRALVDEKRRGPGLALVGLEIDHVAFTAAHEDLGLSVPLPFVPWREVKPIADLAAGGAEQVGYATCGTWSPTVKKYIALAQVAPAVAVPGRRLAIDLMVDRKRQSFAATVAPLPFFNPERKRA
jgi:aminomethyltransferase